MSKMPDSLNPNVANQEMRLIDLLQKARNLLMQDVAGGAVNTNASLDVKILTEWALGISPIDQALDGGQMISVESVGKLLSLVERRATGEPVSQIIGEKEFWSLSFKVTKHTLTPRPDSETLIEWALETVKNSKSFHKSLDKPSKPLEKPSKPLDKQSRGLETLTEDLEIQRKILEKSNQFTETSCENQKTSLKILDLGTGTGCLLLSLLSELPEAQGVGVDLSEKALEVAKFNATQLGFSDKVNFIQSHWFEGVPKGEVFDIILCNPPYIAWSERPELTSDVKDFEPESALFSDSNGLKDYKIISRHLAQYLTPDGFVIFEIGHDQSEKVTEIMRISGAKEIETRKDLGGNDRAIRVFF